MSQKFQGNKNVEKQVKNSFIFTLETLLYTKIETKKHDDPLIKQDINWYGH